MAISWMTGACLRQNRLEWTVLRRMKETWEVHARGHADLPAPEGADGAASAAALKPYLREFKGQLAIALPLERVLLRVALLPSTEAEELRGMADLQTDKFSPFPVETVISGVEVLEASGASSLACMAVVRREDVESLGRLFQEAGGLPDKVDAEALGWWWGVRHGGKIPAHGSQILLRATAAGVDMAVVRDGAPLMFRSLPGRVAAEGGHDGWIDECVEEVADSLTALETEWGGTGAPTLHVFHETALPLECAERLRKALGLEAVFAHALDDLPTASEGVARRLAEPAVPLAMDLTPAEWRAAEETRQMRRKWLRAATVFLAAWLVAVGAFWVLLNVQRGRLARLRAQVEEIEAPAMEIRRLRAKVAEFTQYADRTHSALECLRLVSESLPAGADLTSYVYRKGATLALRGEADVPDKVYAFIQALEKAELFLEVKSEGISTRNTPQGNRSQFGVTVRLPGIGEGEP